MPYRDVSFLDLICDPETEDKLERAEQWLFNSEHSLYPVLCDTPVLVPGSDEFLHNQYWNVLRAMAELDESSDIRHWFLSRYNRFDQPEPPPIDTEVLGEGYPGFWDLVDVPPFLEQLDSQNPESYIIDVVGDRTKMLALDIGCGQGGMMQLMAPHCRLVLGLEYNFYLAATANNLLRARQIDIDYFVPEAGRKRVTLEKQPVTNGLVICGDAMAMPFCEPLFDWVHCGHVLDLVDDPAEVIATAKRILKPGGLLSISTPWDIEHEGHFDDMLEMLVSDFRELFKLDGIPWLRYNHKRRFVLHEDWIWVGKQGM